MTLLISPLLPSPNLHTATQGFTGRFYSLLDPTYAKEHIPIIASVSEHQPTTWAAFYFDFHILMFLVPAGLYLCFSGLTEQNIFAVLYCITSTYFTGVMVRLVLLAGPAACVIGGIAASHTFSSFFKLITAEEVCRT